MEPTDMLLERLFELATLLVDGMEAGLSQRGLSRARAEVLWRLQRHGSMTQNELSQMLQCTPRNVTSLVDALQADGLVARSPHPTDRRAKLVHLTEQGSAAAAAWLTRYQQLALRLFADIAPTELTQFATLLDQLLGRLHDEASTPATRVDES